MKAITNNNFSAFPLSYLLKYTQMTLDEIMKELYFKKETYFLDIFGKIKHNQTTLYADRNNCRSEQQVERWLMLNDLLNVSAYLNAGWKPDWKNSEEEKFILRMRQGQVIADKTDEPCHFVYFKSRETAENALSILGETFLKQLLGA